MSRLLELSAELILCVASFVEQVDLLNVSLTCKHLQEVTKSERYRLYSNPYLHGRTIAEFVVHLVQHPELARYVKEVDLKGWDTLKELNPEDYEANYEMSGIRTTREEKAETFDRFQKPEPTEDEYYLLVAAAAASGIIRQSIPYETESAIIQKARPMLSTDTPHDSRWYANILGDTSTWQSVPYDQKFCELLRAGIDDAYAVLLLGLLPHLSHIFLRGAGTEPTALGLPRPLHAFKALRTLKIGCMDMQDAWGIDYFQTLLTHAPLEELYVHNASSWCQQDPDIRERSVRLQLQPASLRLTKLELVNCTLRRADMQTLLTATRSLRSLLYWTGNEDTGPENFLSQELVEMLEPFKDTLEQLYLEMEHFWGDSEADGLIKTLSHFTALRILDTTTEMWEDLLYDEVDPAQLNAEQLFCHRLPRNLETLILHPPCHYVGVRNWDPAPDVPARCQIESVLTRHSDLLPHLQDIYIGSASVDGRSALNDIGACCQQFQPSFRITIDTSGCRTSPTRSFFDSFLTSLKRPSTKWDGQKYISQLD